MRARGGRHRWSRPRRRPYPISRFLACSASHLLRSCRFSFCVAATCTKHTQLELGAPHARGPSCRMGFEEPGGQAQASCLTCWMSPGWASRWPSKSRVPAGPQGPVPVCGWVWGPGEQPVEGRGDPAAENTTLEGRGPHVVSC